MKTFRSPKYYEREVKALRLIRKRTPSAAVTKVVYTIPSRCIVMQRYDEILHDRIQARTCPPDAFRQLVKIVTDLQKSRVAHMDIKPRNVMVHDTRIVLVDFGSASTWHSESVCEGTFPYMAPEVAYGRRARKCDVRASDVWSLGVILLEIACPHVVRDWFENEISAMFLASRAYEVGWSTAKEYLMLTDPSRRVVDVFEALGPDERRVLEACFTFDVAERLRLFDEVVK